MRIECVDYTKVIRGSTVLDHVNYTFEGGRIYGLQGKNGSGKTMLIRALCGLIRPSSGKVILNGKEIGKDIEFPESIGLLLEGPAFLGEFSGRDNLLQIARIRKRITESQVDQAISSVGLNPEDRKKYKKYSLGMKQRLGIAAAIMENPELVFLDEPANALDTDGMRLIRNILNKMKDEKRIIILSSHDKEELEELSDEILVMESGRIKEVKMNA